MFYLSIGIAASFALLFLAMCMVIRHQRMESETTLEMVCLMGKIAKNQSLLQDEVVKHLSNLYTAYNEFAAFSSKRLTFTAAGTQYTLACLRPYIISLLNESTKNDKYEDAKECQKILDEITSFIQYQFNNDSKTEKK